MCDRRALDRGRLHRRARRPLHPPGRNDRLGPADSGADDGELRDPYNYSGLTYPEIPFPKSLGLLLDRLERRLGYRPNDCLANCYPDGGSTMRFHDFPLRSGFLLHMSAELQRSWEHAILAQPGP